MPTYLNSTARSITLRGGISGKKHATVRKNSSATTDFYPTVLPVGVTFVSHEPVSSPFKELANIHEFPSDPVLCMGYNSLMFHNETSDVVGFYANGDTANVLEIPVGVFMTIDADGLFGSIVFVYGGSSSKGVTLWGS